MKTLIRVSGILKDLYGNDYIFAGLGETTHF